MESLLNILLLTFFLAGILVMFILLGGLIAAAIESLKD
jgi:hypothetical protein